MVTRTNASPVAAGAWRATLVRSFRSAVALVAMINLVRGCYTGSGTSDKLNLVTANRSSLSGHFRNRLRKAFKERRERGHYFDDQHLNDLTPFAAGRSGLSRPCSQK